MYANTLYRAKPQFFHNVQWGAIDNWEAVLRPHYDTAEHMLGLQTVPFDSANQQLIRDMARHFGTEETSTRTPNSVFFGEANKTVADP